jgi:hypothetical protein
MTVYEKPCAGCGLRLLRDDAHQTIAHEAPECEWFKGLLVQVPPSRTIVSVIRGAPVLADTIFEAAETSFEKAIVFPEPPAGNRYSRRAWGKRQARRK